jgi:hypothetical protein
VLETIRDLRQWLILEQRVSRHFRSFFDAARTSRGPGAVTGAARGQLVFGNARLDQGFFNRVD